MRPGGLLFALVVVGYVGFEVNAVRQSRYRFEPLYTFDQFASMNHATERCGSPEADQRERFLRNLASVRRRAGEDLAETHPQESPDQIEQRVVERTRAREREVDALIESVGCGDREVWKLLKRYEQRARLNIR